VSHVGWFIANVTLPNGVITPWKVNSSHLKNDDWKTTFLLKRSIFRRYVKLWECKSIIVFTWIAPKQSPNKNGGPASSVAMLSNHVANQFDLQASIWGEFHP